MRELDNVSSARVEIDYCSGREQEDDEVFHFLNYNSNLCYSKKV